MLSAKIILYLFSISVDDSLYNLKRTTLLITIIIFGWHLCAAHTFASVDTCIVNDFCENAIDLPQVYSDSPFACIDGCTMDATAEQFNNNCEIGVFPTVWYRVHTDYFATLMNIGVYSEEIESPVISLFWSQTDCDVIIPIPLTQNYLDCLVGSNGSAEVIAAAVISDAIYFIAVSSKNPAGGAFSLCVNTISNGSNCVVDREIVVTSRSAGGDLAGPFNPGETVGICMVVKSYTASVNGCQWFQGLVPAFGNGWDPSSFDANYQPFNTTINGNPIGLAANGIYGVATWDWFADVDYHQDDAFRHIGDFDGNGNADMCSGLYEADCPNTGGMMGGCCNPCWGNPLGTILPNGWFAYGINGSCATPGPPIRVDWGDGGSCGSNQGPWEFCFDLIVREYPHCLEDATTSDLSLGFFTFSDAETGAWTGNASLCAMDQPARLDLSMACSLETDLGVERVEDRCAGGTFTYTIDEPGIRNWIWTTYPSWAVLNSANEGDNGFTIEDELFSPVSTPVEVIYYFTGYEEGTSNIVVKQVRFKIIPDIKSSLPDAFYACEKDTNELVIPATPLSGGLAPYQYLWMPNGDTTSFLTVFPPLESSVFSVHIHDSIGCLYQKELALKVLPCHLDTIVSEDESDDPHTYEDGPKGKGNFIAPTVTQSSTAFEFENELKVYPIPATDFIHIEWSKDLDDATVLMVYDPRGFKMYHDELSRTEREEHRMQMNVREYADGVYLVVLQTGKSMLASRMVKI